MEQVKVYGSFVVHVAYIQPPFKELLRRFDYVHSYFDKCFFPIERCKDVPLDAREVSFVYVQQDRNGSSDEAFNEMEQKGLRPALYEELLCFAKAYPDEQMKFPIVALGSEVEMNDRYYAAFLDNNGVRPNLRVRRYRDFGTRSDHFLATEK